MLVVSGLPPSNKGKEIEVVGASCRLVNIVLNKGSALDDTHVLTASLEIRNRIYEFCVVDMILKFDGWPRPNFLLEVLSPTRAETATTSPLLLC